MCYGTPDTSKEDSDTSKEDLDTSKEDSDRYVSLLFDFVHPIIFTVYPDRFK